MSAHVAVVALPDGESAGMPAAGSVRVVMANKHRLAFVGDLDGAASSGTPESRLQLPAFDAELGPGIVGAARFGTGTLVSQVDGPLGRC